MVRIRYFRSFVFVEWIVIKSKRLIQKKMKTLDYTSIARRFLFSFRLVQLKCVAIYWIVVFILFRNSFWLSLSLPLSALMCHIWTNTFHQQSQLLTPLFHFQQRTTCHQLLQLNNTSPEPSRHQLHRSHQSHRCNTIHSLLLHQLNITTSASQLQHQSSTKNQLCKSHNNTIITMKLQLQPTIHQVDL